MEILKGLCDIGLTIVSGFFTTPGLNILTYSALTIGCIRLFWKAIPKL